MCVCVFVTVEVVVSVVVGLVMVVVAVFVVEGVSEVVSFWFAAGRIKISSFRKQNTEHIMAVAII